MKLEVVGMEKYISSIMTDFPNSPSHFKFQKYQDKIEVEISKSVDISPWKNSL